MNLALYQVDAFSARPFGGNPAAVCPLQAWLPDDTLQAIAAEENLSETAFFVPNGEAYDLRWMTPTIEVDLCGHATLASGYVIMTLLRPDLDMVAFDTRSGRLAVRRDGDRFVLDFPAKRPRPWTPPPGFDDAIGATPRETHVAGKAMAVFDTAEAVAAIDPDFDFIAGMDSDGLIVTAPGKDVDFVSRYFAPHAGIPEDPVTGAAHTLLTPYWAERLGKPRLVARQGKARQGLLYCTDRGERVDIGGPAALYSEGEIRL